MLPSIAYGFKTCSEKFKIRAQEKFINRFPATHAIFKAGGAPALRLVLDAENEKARAEKIAKAALQIDPSVAALAQFRK